MKINLEAMENVFLGKITIQREHCLLRQYLFIVSKQHSFHVSGEKKGPWFTFLHQEVRHELEENGWPDSVWFYRKLPFFLGSCFFLFLITGHQNSWVEQEEKFNLETSETADETNVRDNKKWHELKKKGKTNCTFINFSIRKPMQAWKEFSSRVRKSQKCNFFFLPFSIFIYLIRHSRDLDRLMTLPLPDPTRLRFI